MRDADFIVTGTLGVGLVEVQILFATTGSLVGFQVVEGNEMRENVQVANGAIVAPPSGPQRGSVLDVDAWFGALDFDVVSNSMNRFGEAHRTIKELFRNYYGRGWGAKAGKPLSPRAVEAFRRFLQEVAFPQGRKPSVCLTDRGGLELCWEDPNQKPVQVAFTSQGIEFYLEATDEEGFFGFGSHEAAVIVFIRAPR